MSAHVMSARGSSETWGQRLVSLAATACLYAFAVPGTLVFAILAILLSALPRRYADGVSFIGRVWSRCLLAAAGARVSVEFGTAPRPGGVVYICNHKSYFDVSVLYASSPRPLRFAAKRSLFRIPFLGWSMKLGGFIPVDRVDRSRARDVFAVAARVVAGGTSVAFFPEGTRAAPGEMLPFQRGGFLVALKAGAPIVPVGIAGTDRVLPRGRLRVTPGAVTVRYGEPIDPGAYGMAGRAALVARVREEVARLAGLTEAIGAAEGAAAEPPEGA